jgi:S-adenosylmethionine uptake transporter
MTNLTTAKKEVTSEPLDSLDKTSVVSSSSKNWFMQKGFPQGAFWATMICVVSVTNDILMRYLGENLHVMEIIFFRFLFSALTVVPIIFSHGLSVFATKRPFLHTLRAIVGVAAIGACCYSVNVMPLSENTTIMFSQPLFFLPMAVLFLREKVDFPRWLATLIGFIGLVIIVQPGMDTFRLVALVPITAALLFATLDIMAKKMVPTENTYAMLMYFAVGTTLAAAIPAFYFWQTPTLKEIILLVLLGIGANMIQVCLIRAFSATDASALMPFRYVEFIFSALSGYILFAELPASMTLFGAIFIIAGTFYISYCETKKEKQA